MDRRQLRCASLALRATTFGTPAGANVKLRTPGREHGGALLLRLRTVLSKNRHCNRSRTHSLAGFGAARPAARLSVAKPEKARQPAD